jgi:acetyl esterase/lipase
MPRVVVTPHLSWQCVFLRLYLKWLKARTDRVHLSVEQQRRGFEKSTALMRLPANITVQKTMIDNVAADWLALSNSPSDAVILYLHGGGYMMGSCKTHRAFAAHVATACKVNNYRLKVGSFGGD